MASCHGPAPRLGDSQGAGQFSPPATLAAPGFTLTSSVHLGRPREGQSRRARGRAAACAAHVPTGERAQWDLCAEQVHQAKTGTLVPGQWLPHCTRDPCLGHHRRVDAHARTHSHTHRHTVTHAHTQPHMLSQSHMLTHTEDTQSHTNHNSQPCTLIGSHTATHPHTHSHTQSHRKAHTHSRTVAHRRTHNHTHKPQLTAMHTHRVSYTHTHEDAQSTQSLGRFSDTNAGVQL